MASEKMVMPEVPDADEDSEGSQGYENMEELGQSQALGFAEEDRQFYEEEEEVDELIDQEAQLALAQKQEQEEYLIRLEQYLKQVAAQLPPAVPPPPVYEELAAQTIKAGRALMRPTPNLFKATFEGAHRQMASETWLQKHIQSFDTGNRRKRKQVLEDFLEYVKQSSLSGMEELFSKEAHRFLLRLTSWFSVTLPLLYALPLQLKVFFVFLEFREQSVVRAFFESGVVLSLMSTLVTDFDCTDEVRCLAVLVLHRLALHGRTCKEVLCSKGLIPHLTECILDGLKWETLKCAGLLLCELFRSNPKYQEDITKTFHSLLESHRRPLVQRVALSAFSALVEEEYAGPEWPDQLIPRLLSLMDGHDMRVCSDSYTFLCALVRSFNCDTKLWEFAREILDSYAQDVDAWAQLEVASERAARGMGPTASQRIADRLRTQAETEILRSPEGCNYTETARGEAAFVLKLSLVMFLTKRSPELCRDLVDRGLTETLLMCLLDIAHPLRQAAVLPEIHRLQLLSKRARQIVEGILVKRELLRAVTLDQFMAAGSHEDFARVRLRLRSLQRGSRRLGFRHSAEEHQLQQRILDQHVADTLGIEASAPAAAFLTEGPASQESEALDEKDEDVIPRSGPGCYKVHRVPVPEDASQETFAQGYSLEHEAQEGLPEPTVLAAFRAVLTDPLSREAEEESPLLQEVHSLCAAARQAPAAPPPLAAAAAAKAEDPERHLARRRAQALASRPSGQGRRAPTSRAVSETASEAGESDATSLVCVAEAKDYNALARTAQHVGLQRLTSASTKLPAKKAGGWPDMSLAETSVGPEMSQELSTDEFSQEMTSIGLQEPTQEFSVLTVGSSGLAGDVSHAGLPDIDEQTVTTSGLPKLRPRVLQAANLAAVVALPRDEPGGGGFRQHYRKKVVCIPAPPYHNCVAFASRDMDEPLGDFGERPLPTHRLMELISEAGRFPRRWLKKSSGSDWGSSEKAPSSARATRTPQLPPVQSGSVSARGKQRPLDLLDKLGGLPARPVSIAEYFPASKRMVDGGL